LPVYLSFISYLYIQVKLDGAQFAEAATQLHQATVTFNVRRDVFIGKDKLMLPLFGLVIEDSQALQRVTNTFAGTKDLGNCTGDQ
jgi:hypothetical protein